MVVCERNQERTVFEELRNLGRFESSGFRDVLKGQVKDRGRFLTMLYRRPFIPVSRIIPIEESFSFHPEELAENLKARIGRYAERIGADESFCIKVERRGLKGLISTMELERELGEYLRQMLRRRYGKEPKVELKGPDKTVTIQTMGNICGIGLISKQLTERFPFVRTK
jgi:tRNA(Ser,Leu) C12 N-acetylase TAN1